jgi:hypothetical protein
MVQGAKYLVKILVRQRCAEGFNPGVKGLTYKIRTPWIVLLNIEASFRICVHGLEVPILTVGGNHVIRVVSDLCLYF